MPPAPGWNRLLDDPALRSIRKELERAGAAFGEADERRRVALGRRRAAVIAAREVGAGWQEIAELLGLESRQAAEGIIKTPARREAAKRRGGR